MNLKTEGVDLRIISVCLHDLSSVLYATVGISWHLCLSSSLVSRSMSLLKPSEISSVVTTCDMRYLQHKKHQ